MNTAYKWLKAYQDAILETDDNGLQEKIEGAQRAIDACLLELSNDGEDAEEEKIALEDALSGLRILRKERLQRQI
jgi:hypothetical protein